MKLPVMLLFGVSLFAACKAMPDGKSGTSSAMGSTSSTAQVEILEVEPVWSGHPVGFCLLTHKGYQFAAYYAANHQVTVASRQLSSKEWKFKRLDSMGNWDSHNGLVIAVDANNCLHVSGNMHASPLIYFRAAKPLDVESLERIPLMVNADDEKKVTYPIFFTGPKGEFLYRYRKGFHADGEDIYNVYEPSSRTWRRFLDKPLTSGKGVMNGYFTLPKQGPDGYYHLLGVWRDAGGAETNHDISYARSRDFLHWETAAGKPLGLPMTLDTIDVVDPVPARGGVINGGPQLAFDSQNRPVISYHKYDKQGKSQVYCARAADGKWQIEQVSDWRDDYRWDFGGPGSLPGTMLGVGAVSKYADGYLVLNYNRTDGKSGQIVLDEKTLSPVANPPEPPKPDEDAIRKFTQWVALNQKIQEMEKDFQDWKAPGMKMNMTFDAGKSGEEGVSYMMKWATLGTNRDRPHEGPVPAPTMLRVYKTFTK